jgi:hypothetical protein
MTSNFKYLLNQDMRGTLREEDVGFNNYESFESICSQTMVGIMVVHSTSFKNDQFRCIVGEKIDPITKKRE